LIDDLRSFFKDDKKVKEVYPEYDGEYADILIKEYYEPIPRISYPCIAIKEIVNNNLKQYSEYDKERRFALDISYQFNIYCEQSENKSANQNIRTIAYILRQFLNLDTYKALNEDVGLVINIINNDTSMRTNNVDNNIRVGYLVYSGVLVPSEHIIYRRY